MEYFFEKKRFYSRFKFQRLTVDHDDRVIIVIVSFKSDWLQLQGVLKPGERIRIRVLPRVSTRSCFALHTSSTRSSTRLGFLPVTPSPINHLGAIVHAFTLDTPLKLKRFYHELATLSYQFSIFNTVSQLRKTFLRDSGKIASLEFACLYKLKRFPNPLFLAMLF